MTAPSREPTEAMRRDLMQRLRERALDEIEYRCTNGHDLCAAGYAAGSECQYCDRSISSDGELLNEAARALAEQDTAARLAGFAEVREMAARAVEDLPAMTWAQNSYDAAVKARACPIPPADNFHSGCSHVATRAGEREGERTWVTKCGGLRRWGHALAGSQQRGICADRGTRVTEQVVVNARTLAWRALIVNVPARAKPIPHRRSPPRERRKLQSEMGARD
jgi:hypothetical protein